MTPDWKQVGPDEWEYGFEGVPPFIAKVRWIPRVERESKNFRFEADMGQKQFYFRTIAGAKRFVENYIEMKGKL